MKVSDYIAKRLADLGVSRCFSVTGGGAMHLNDSFGETQEIACTYLHHEQACAIAAEGYARIAGKPAVVNVTSGPGAINALNGVFGAFTDSIPMIVVSGQVKTDTLLERVGDLPLRQLGDQEARSSSFVPAFVKFFKSVRSAVECIEAVDRAVSLAVSGRPGPCWIEIPVDIQGAQSEALSIHLGQPLATTPGDADSPPISPNKLQLFAEILAISQRPLLLLGTGVRLSNAQTEVLSFAESLNIPIVTAWTHDICDNSHRLFIGRPGTIGTRPGNFAVQACDLLIVVGSRLNIRQVSYNWRAFAPRAKVVMVDIDSAELQKPYLKIHLPIHADAKDFVNAVQRHLHGLAGSHLDPQCHTALGVREEWISRLRKIVDRYSARQSDYKIAPAGEGINPYHFVFSLSGHLRGSERIVCGDATACIVPFQIMHLKDGQRMFSNSGCASMGYDLPAGIGAALAGEDLGEATKTIVLAGDGSLMMNIQELQSLASSDLDIVLFVLDNNGYLSIKQTQSNFFGREHGASPRSGVAFPDFARLAAAFGLPVVVLDNDAEMNETLDSLLHKSSGPRVCVVKLYEGQEFEPRLKSKIVDGTIRTPELDDMFPHISSEELESVRSGLTGQTLSL